MQSETKYTKFRDALDTITNPQPGNVNDFLKYLEARVKSGKFMGTPPPAELAPEIEPLPDLFDEHPENADDSTTYEDRDF